ncbi:MAG: glycosyltransferase [Eubacterium sp.]|nr:glycosyltransferase [Eubacterium sp.]
MQKKHSKRGALKEAPEFHKGKQPLISVMMPVYNMAGDRALHTAVLSVLHQTYKNWELLLCDDGSTDGTVRVLRQFASMDGRVCVIQNPQNRGAGAARNACIRAAKGKYLAVMDADDISDPTRLEQQASFLEGNPEYALVGSNVWMRNRQGIWGRRSMEQEPGRQSFLNTLPFAHPSVMMRTDIVKKMHGYSTARFARRAEDYELLMRLYAAGYRGFNIQEELLSYLEEPGSYQKRKYRDRAAECVVRFQGFHRLGILKGSLRYVLKPLAVGLVPGWMQRAYRKKRFAVQKPPSENKRSKEIGNRK